MPALSTYSKMISTATSCGNQDRLCPPDSSSGMTFKSARVVKVHNSFAVLEPFLTLISYRTKTVTFITLQLSITNTSANLSAELIEGKRCQQQAVQCA
jgi:hypothetical protein